MGELFPHADEMADTEYRPDAANLYGFSRRLSAVDHDGDRYCPPCARELLGDAEFKRYITEPETVAAGGPVFDDSESDMVHHCGNEACGRQIDMVVLGTD